MLNTLTNYLQFIGKKKQENLAQMNQFNPHSDKNKQEIIVTCIHL